MGKCAPAGQRHRNECEPNTPEEIFEALKKKILKKENISGLVIEAVGNLGMVGGRVGREHDQNMLYEILK